MTLAEDRWSLHGKTALVTGCTSGIGLGIADELLRFGAKVLGVARDSERLREWAARREGTRAMRGDVTSAEDRDLMFREIEQLDILINNAGTNIRKPTAEYTDEEYLHLRETNMDSVFAMCRAAYPSSAPSWPASRGPSLCL